LAQIRHFFGEKCLPQARLLMLHSDHGMKTIQNRIRLFCFGLRLAVPTIPYENDLILHRKVGYAFSRTAPRKSGPFGAARCEDWFVAVRVDERIGPPWRVLAALREIILGGR